MEFSAVGCVHLNQWLSNWFLLFSAEHSVGMDSDSETESLRETHQEAASLRLGGGSGGPGPAGFRFSTPWWP